MNLVENLLSVTRLEDGRMNLHISAELVEDVVTEALKHVNRKRTEHNITVEHKDEFLLGRMDAKLIVQVIINIVDNAIKYTPKETAPSPTPPLKPRMASSAFLWGLPAAANPRCYG